MCCISLNVWLACLRIAYLDCSVESVAPTPLKLPLLEGVGRGDDDGSGGGVVSGLEERCESAEADGDGDEDSIVAPPAAAFREDASR